MSVKKFLTLFLSVFIASTGVGADFSPEQSLRFSSEALSNARYNKAISISEEFLNHNINTNICTSEILVAHLSNLRRAYESLGKDSEYKTYCRQLFEMIDINREGTLIRVFFIISLDCLGDYEVKADLRHSFSDFGDNQEGLKFFDSHMGTLPEEFLTQRPLLRAWIPIIRAEILSYGQDFEEAEKEIKKSAEIINMEFDIDKPERLISDIALEILNARKGNWKEAVNLAVINRRELERINPESKEAYAVNARLLYYLCQTGELSEALKVAEKATIRESVYDNAPCLINYRSVEGPALSNSPSTLFAGRNFYLSILKNAEALFASGKTSEGAGKAGKVLYLIQKDIADNYSKFAFNRASAKLKGEVDLLVRLAPDFSIMTPNDSLIQGLAYDAAMMYKQLSLSAGTIYRDLAMNSGNQVLIDRYEELAQTRNLLDKVMPEEVDALLEKIRTLESNLEKHLSNRYSVSLSGLPKWKDVKSILKKEDVAVEFSIAQNPHGEMRYIASLIKEDSEFPEVVELCKIEELDGSNKNLFTSGAYSLLWQPLEKHLSGIGNIYFSPIGNLNLLPVEYFLSETGEPFNDKFNVVRLSSTRELIAKRPANRPASILLYGGIKYELNDEEKNHNDNIARSLENELFSDNSMNNEFYKNSDTRAGIAYLPGTLDEIHFISDLFVNSRGEQRMMEGSEATETSIKKLSRGKMDVLHIATHGFTVSNKSRTRLGKILAKNDNRSTFEEQSLSRSGLLMAGAANTLGVKAYDNINSFDDGILTGLEISRLDLSGIKTVVLSACESGLGEVAAEGVYGLQRGLKRAGVKTLVMSLWKVSDEATVILMREFYNNLLKGKNASAALRDAQKYIREVDGGKYDDFEYWGAFIILDAI